MFDLHCHLDLFPRPQEVVAECQRRNLQVLSVTTTPKAWRGTLALAREFPAITTALGLHPELAHQRSHELPLFEALLSQTAWLGEIGLDGSRRFREHQTVQLRVFRAILEMSRGAGGKVLSIHSRGAAATVLGELDSRPDSGIPILHWFTGTLPQLRRASDMGCWFSVGPAMLASAKGRALAEAMPKMRVLPETDGPFGRVNGRILMPWDAEQVTQMLAPIWRMPIVDIKALFETNYRTLTKQATFRP